jgi:hypothetical protein
MAHSVKGLAATFDGHPTSRAAFEVEKLAAEGNLAAASDALPELVSQVERLRLALTDLIQSQDGKPQ